MSPPSTRRTELYSVPTIGFRSPSPLRGEGLGVRGNAVKHSSYRKPNTPPCRSRLRPAIRIGGQSPLLQKIGRFRHQLQVRPRQECLTALGEGAGRMRERIQASTIDDNHNENNANER